MDFREDFLNEFRKTIQDILVEGDLERLNLAKEFLGYDNQAFGEFLAPLFKEEQELVLHHTLAYPETPQNLVVVPTENHNLLAEGKAPFQGITAQSMIETDEPLTDECKQEPKYKWCPKVFSADAKGDLCGIVLVTERGFEIEDVETGEVLYANNFEVYKRFDLSHGLVITFSISGSYLYNVSYESSLNPKNGMVYIENCPLERDNIGYYVPSDSEGNSLREHGSRCGVYNISDFIVKKYRLSSASSVDLVIKEGEIPRIAWVHHNNSFKPKPISRSKDTSTSTKKTFEKYDFDLRGKKVAIIGLPKSQVERFKSLVLTEKGADELEFIASSSHNDTELVPDKLKDFDIVVVVKRFVGHGTVYHLKTLLTDSSAQLVSSTSHGLDGLERALYRGLKGYPSEEGATVVDYPLVKA